MPSKEFLQKCSGQGEVRKAREMGEELIGRQSSRQRRLRYGGRDGLRGITGTVGGGMSVWEQGVFRGFNFA